VARGVAVSEHTHDWQPIPGETGQYRCACDATGWRSRTGIVEHRKRKTYRKQWTAKSGIRPQRIADDWDPGRNDQ